MAEPVWHSPDDAIAEGFFEADEPVVAVLEDGTTAALTYGHLSSPDDDDDLWMGFYDGDGMEVRIQNIKSVRAAHPTVHSKGAM